MKRKIISLVTIPITFVFRLWTPLSGETIHIPGDFSTIQSAIDASADDDVVEILPVMLSGTGNVNVSFGGLDIVVTSRVPDGARPSKISDGHRLPSTRSPSPRGARKPKPGGSPSRSALR